MKTSRLEIQKSKITQLAHFGSFPFCTPQTPFREKASEREFDEIMGNTMEYRPLRFRPKQQRYCGKSKIAQNQPCNKLHFSLDKRTSKPNRLLHKYKPVTSPVFTRTILWLLKGNFYGSMKPGIHLENFVIITSHKPLCTHIVPLTTKCRLAQYT